MCAFNKFLTVVIQILIFKKKCGMISNYGHLIIYKEKFLIEEARPVLQGRRFYNQFWNTYLTKYNFKRKFCLALKFKVKKG